MRWISILFLLSACAPSDDAGAGIPTAPIDTSASSEESVSATTVRLDSTTAWSATPFPGDPFVATGGLKIPTQFPNPRADEPLFDRIRELLAPRAGFCTTCNIVFGFDGALDPRSVDGLAAIVDLSDLIELPAELEWRPGTQTLSMRPAHGHALLPNREYVAVLRRGVRGDDGLEIGAVQDPPDELFGEDLVAFTRFRTGDPARQLRAVREQLLTVRAPSASVSGVLEGVEIDALLGAGQTEPGFERPAADAERFAVRHQSTRTIVTGTFDAPRFLDGVGADVGVVRRNDAGMPTVASTDDVPFVLVVPEGADLTNLGIVVVHHGFAASRVTALALADTAGEAGWAVLGIDAYQHGERALLTTDRERRLRGVDGADGFAETTMLDVVSRVFGLGGVPAELRLCPGFALSAFTQFVADALSAIRFVREGDISAIRGATGLEELRFDPDRVVFVGNSMGAVVGTGVIAVEPELAGAVLNVMPGSIIETLVESGEFRPMSERIFLPLLGVEHEFDGVDRKMLFDPTVDLFRWVMEPVDPLALASSRVVDNVLVQLAGHDEVAAPRPSRSVVDVGGLEQVSIYPDAMHGMLEVAEQSSEFEAPLSPPFTRREQPIALANPIDAVHDEITDFLLAIDAR